MLYAVVRLQADKRMTQERLSRWLFFCSPCSIDKTVKKNHYRESANCGDRLWAAIKPVAMAPYTLISKDFSQKFQLALSRQ